jgi:hypothetical protein
MICEHATSVWSIVVPFDLVVRIHILHCTISHEFVNQFCAHNLNKPFYSLNSLIHTFLVGLNLLSIWSIRMTSKTACVNRTFCGSRVRIRMHARTHEPWYHGRVAALVFSAKVRTLVRPYSWQTAANNNLPKFSARSQFRVCLLLSSRVFVGSSTHDSNEQQMW